MKMNWFAKLVFCLLGLTASVVWAESVVVIGHGYLPKLDSPSIKRLYKGRVTEVNGIPVTVVNAPAGTAVRSRFLSSFLGEDDEHYIAYWTVRHFIGKGSPPRELESTAAIIDYVQKTPGSIGYIDAADLRPGLNVLSRQ